MNLSKSKTGTRFLIYSLIIAFVCIFFSYNNIRWSTFVAILGGLVVMIAIVVAIKTTIVTWITVLVLLAFAGKRRRVLVVEGKKITKDVAVLIVRVLIKEKSVVAGVACAATIVSSMAAMLFLRKTN